MRNNTTETETEKINELIFQFENMRAMPIIEIEINGDYAIYNLHADKEGIHTSCGLSVEWDINFSLDSHLEAMLDEINQTIY